MRDSGFKDHVHDVVNPALPYEGSGEAIRVAHADAHVRLLPDISCPLLRTWVSSIP